MQKYLKSIYAGLIYALGSTSAAYVAGGGHIGLVAGCSIASGVITSVAVVWGVTNAPKEAA